MRSSQPTKDAPPNIAVVGAGVSGARSARLLHDQGIDVTVFDKSRGVGGRMATRRRGDCQWDHGAQYFSGQRDAFQRFISDCPSWHIDGKQMGQISAPQQNSLVKQLIEPVTVQLGEQINRLEHSDQGWLLHATNRSSGPFSHVVLALPAPQARALVPHVSLFADISDVTMDPCWALLAATAAPLDQPDAQRSPSAEIAWIAADHSKPGRNASMGQYVVHATAEWSRAHLEDTAETVCALLLDSWREAAGAPLPVTYATAHRWRHALTARAAGQDCFYAADQRLGICGDWCLGDRVEDAFDSGSAMANALLADLALFTKS